MIDAQRSPEADPAGSSDKVSGEGFASRWRWPLRLLGLLGLLLFGYLLSRAFAQLDWAEVVQALGKLQARQLLIGGMLVAACYLAASSYELLGKAHEAHTVPWPGCLAIGFVAYSTAANLSSLLGNWAARYRLYSRRGLSFGQTTRVAVLGISSNWCGFVLLAGLVFSLAPPILPQRWPVADWMLRLIGAALLITVIGYLLWCQRSAGQSLQIRSVRFKVPTWSIAARQLALSVLVWIGMAAVMTNFMPAKATLLQVLPVLFISTVSGLILRVPAGVGVAEVTFVTLLGSRLGAANIIAALLAYRALFQLLPLCLAAVVYFALELTGKRRVADAAT